jgi:hypothetical protein
MSRGPRPYRAITGALVIARLRGKVHLTENGPETQYDFTITAVTPVSFVRVKYAGRILAPLSEILESYRDEIFRLRSITNNTGISRELWLRSKHGTWRFFRVTEEGLIELDRSGLPLFVSG